MTTWKGSGSRMRIAIQLQPALLPTALPPLGLGYRFLRVKLALYTLSWMWMEILLQGTASVSRLSTVMMC